jgi:hypothetical protein
MKNLEIAQDKPDAAKVQCRGRFDRSGSSSALSSPLSLISSLQLEELELDDHLEGSLLLLGWRGETLAFALDVANENGDASEEGSASAYIAQWDEPHPLDQTDLKQWRRLDLKGGGRPWDEACCQVGPEQVGRPYMWGWLAYLNARWATLLVDR